MSPRGRGRTTRSALVGCAAAAALLLAGCSAPGELTSLLVRPQTEADRMGGFASSIGVDPGSTRFLAEHEGSRYWVGEHAEMNLLCLVISDAETELLVMHHCGRLPIHVEWGISAVRLLPDGMSAPESWTAVTPNLAVR